MMPEVIVDQGTAVKIGTAGTKVAAQATDIADGSILAIQPNPPTTARSRRAANNDLITIESGFGTDTAGGTHPEFYGEAAGCSPVEGTVVGNVDSIIYTIEIDGPVYDPGRTGRTNCARGIIGAVVVDIGSAGEFIEFPISGHSGRTPCWLSKHRRCHRKQNGAHHTQQRQNSKTVE